MNRKLGKQAPIVKAKTLMLSKYLSTTAPLNPPSSVDWSEGITDWGMMCNDKVGSCTISAVGHAVQTWTRVALGRELTVPDTDILKYYSLWDGFDPANPGATDNGGSELAVLTQWRQQGFSGQPLDAFAAIDMRAPAEWNRLIHTAIWLFGGAYIGVELPVTASDQVGNVWDVPKRLGPNDEVGSWGGHAVYLVASNPTELRCVTWGKIQRMTWPWLEKYCSESYALISKDWISTTGIAPSGFDLATLASDLKIVTA